MTISCAKQTAQQDSAVHVSDVISIKRGYGYGVSGTYSQTFTNTVETTQSSDDLGSFIVQYTDKVVLNKANSRATIKTYSTGHVDAQIIPFYE